MKATNHISILWIPLVALVLLVIGLAIMPIFAELSYNYLHWA